MIKRLHKYLPNLSVAALCLFFSLLSYAADNQGELQCSAVNSDCVAVGKWDVALGVGVGGRSNPIVDNDNLPILLLPNVSYYGQRFFWETDTIGFTLVENPKHIVNMIATVSYDQMFFRDYGIGNFSIEGSGSLVGDNGDSNHDPLEDDIPPSFVDGATPTPSPGGPELPTPAPSPTPTPSPGDERNYEQGESVSDRLHKRDMAGLMGVEYSYGGERRSIGFQVLQDVTRVHNGGQVRIAYTEMLYESAYSRFIVNLGLEWKDSKTLDYYFGLRPEEVEGTTMPAYVLQSDFSYYLKLDWRRRISRRWELRGIIHHRSYGSEIYNSPIVEENYTVAAFVGGVYHF